MFVVLYATPMPEKKGGTKVCDSGIPSEEEARYISLEEAQRRYAFAPEPQTPDEFDEIHDRNMVALNRAQQETYEVLKREFLEWLDRRTNEETARFAAIIEQIENVRRATKQDIQPAEIMRRILDHDA